MTTLEEIHGVAVLTLAHGKANAIDCELLETLRSRLAEIRISQARAVVLTGTGSIFSAGVDLYRVLEEDDGYLDRFVPLLSRSLFELFTFPLPVIAALNGHAIAGGCILAASCDRRIMAAGKWKVGVSELLVGVPFPVVPLEILRARVPRRFVDELIFTGRLVEPDEGVSLGLVDEVCPAERLIDRALCSAESLARIPAEAFALTKRQLQSQTIDRIERSRPLFDEEVAGMWRSGEAKARIRKYLETNVGRGRSGPSRS